jgi:hypothetical protein
MTPLHIAVDILGSTFYIQRDFSNRCGSMILQTPSTSSFPVLLCLSPSSVSDRFSHERVCNWNGHHY